LKKHDLHSTSTNAGTSIVLTPVKANAYSSIRCSFECDSNVTDVSDVQLKKHLLHSTTTDAGTAIVLKTLRANADSSIRCNLESDSNVIDVSDSHL
jgi:hypothetical protein